MSGDKRISWTTKCISFSFECAKLVLCVCECESACLNWFRSKVRKRANPNAFRLIRRYTRVVYEFPIVYTLTIQASKQSSFHAWQLIEPFFLLFVFFLLCLYSTVPFSVGRCVCAYKLHAAWTDFSTYHHTQFVLSLWSNLIIHPRPLFAQITCSARAFRCIHGMSAFHGIALHHSSLLTANILKSQWFRICPTLQQRMHSTQLPINLHEW